MEIMEFQIEQLRKDTGLLVVCKLATNLILGPTFTGKYITKFGFNSGLIVPSDSKPVAIVYETQRDYIMTISIDNSD